MKTVILGTAHGSNVAGKRSPDGRLREFKYSREICHMVREQLTERGIRCIIDIEDDLEPSLSGRVARVNRLATKHGDCIYVSIHNNAAGSDGQWHSARGFSVFVSPNASTQSKLLATTLLNTATGMNLQGNRHYPSTGYHIKSLAVCRDTCCPAVLTENLFQDNREDVDFLLSAEGRKTIAQLHTQAILAFLNA
ncbi:MAG: N-acetylmuramoyl-L-alanine amidase [Muribaculaceae bacterium]|nr:N-acetylmuramoyl-L-alanine amidase [Muribaculaceae bacterium]